MIEFDISSCVMFERSFGCPGQALLGSPQRFSSENLIAAAVESSRIRLERERAHEMAHESSPPRDFPC